MFLKSGAPLPYLMYTATTFLGRVVEAPLKQAPTEPSLERCNKADMVMLLLNMTKEYSAAQRFS